MMDEVVPNDAATAGCKFEPKQEEGSMGVVMMACIVGVMVFSAVVILAGVWSLQEPGSIALAADEE